MVFLSGVQQKLSGRIISPCEKPLQQAEAVSSHPRAKKLHLDDSVSGGSIVIVSERSSTKRSSLINVGLNLLLSSLLFPSDLSPTCCPFISRRLREAPSVASPSGVGKEGVSASGPRKAGHRKAPGAGGLKAPGAASLPCLTTESLLLAAFSPFLYLSFASSWTSVSVVITHLSNPAAHAQLLKKNSPTVAYFSI